MRRGTIRNVLTYIGRYKWLAFLSFVLAGVTVALTLLAPYLAGLAIDQIAEDGVHFDRLMSLLMQIALCVAATAAIQWVMNVVNNRVTFSVVRDLREDALRKIEILPLSYIDSHPHGEIVSRVIADADCVRRRVADGLYAAVYRRADHTGHAGIHSFFMQGGHRRGRRRGHAAVAVRGEVYRPAHA